MTRPDPDTERFVARLVELGLTEDEARYYARDYPRTEWLAILEWAGSPPGIDACDDIEADQFWA